MTLTTLKPWMALSVLVFLTACATPQPLLYIKQDLAQQQTIIGVIRNRLDHAQINRQKSAEAFFSPQWVLTPDGVGHFQFVVQVKQESGPFMLIKPGTSLTLYVDGKRRTFSTRLGSGPRRVLAKQWGITTYSESAVYNGVSKSDISEIILAQAVKVQIYGVRSRLTADFSEQNFAAFEAVLLQTDKEKPLDVANCLSSNCAQQ